MSIPRRKIKLSLKLGKGAFGESGFDAVTYEGLRVNATITNGGGPSLGQADVRVYGLPLERMNQLAQVMRMPNGNILTRFNQLSIEAGDDESGMALVFQGQIILAPIDLSGSPESALHITAQAGAFEAVQSVNPRSYPVSADVAVILQSLAEQAGYKFENNGVSVILATPYLSGSLGEQIQRCRDAAGIEMSLDNGVLAIWPRGGARGSTNTPIVSKETGMNDYPINWDTGLFVRTTFNPNLGLGKPVEVKSILPFGNGKFVVFNVSHHIESESPNGEWFTTFYASPIVNEPVTK